MSIVDIALIEGYLHVRQIVLENLDVSHTAILLERVQNLLASTRTPLPLSSSIQITVRVGLDAGILRKNRPNEDFAFATVLFQLFGWSFVQV